MKNKTINNKAIGYVRVSTYKQADSGLSIEGQIKEIKRTCNLKNLDLIEIIIENNESKYTSGGSMQKRKGLQRLINQYIKTQTVSYIIIWELSRLARNLKDIVIFIDELKELNIKPIFIKEDFDFSTASGKLHFNNLATFAEYMRGVASERTYKALLQKKIRGEPTGGFLYGFRYKNKQLIIVEEEQKIIKKIINSYKYQKRQGKINYSAIANKLNKKNIPTQRGGKWGCQQIKNVIKNRKIYKQKGVL